MPTVLDGLCRCGRDALVKSCSFQRKVKTPAIQQGKRSISIAAFSLLCVGDWSDFVRPLHEGNTATLL